MRSIQRFLAVAVLMALTGCAPTPVTQEAASPDEKDAATVSAEALDGQQASKKLS